MNGIVSKITLISKMKNLNNTIFNRILLIIATLFSFSFILLNFVSSNFLVAQNLSTNHTNQKQKIKFPDKYSSLDNTNNKAVKVITAELITETLETSRHAYVKGLIVLQKQDTLEALKYFEEALTGLNKLFSYPDINKNDDFRELLENIFSDYEKCLKSAPDNYESIIASKDRLFLNEEFINQYQQKDDTVTNYYIPREEYTRLPTAGLSESKEYTFTIPNLKDLTIPITDNQAVEEQIDLLTKRFSSFFPRWMESSSRWFPMMKEIAQTEGMPEEIILLTFIESSLNPLALSPAGAVGLWQFMYNTGIDYGLNRRQSIWVDERRDPIKSTRAGLRYLRDLYLEFNDWHLALCAYNWGWGNVKRALKQVNKDKPTYWDIRNQKNVKMPTETQKYVPLFIAVLKITSNPARYGIDVSKLNYSPEFKYDVVEIDQATNLKAVAQVIGVGISEIKDLNPELLYDITPPDRRFYSLRVPVGSSKDFQEKFAQLSLEERQPALQHRVLRGEDIISVAEKYNVSIDELILLNGIGTQTIEIASNTILKIPIGGRTYAQSTLINTRNGLVNKTSLVSTDSNFYIAQSTESVYSIAAKFKISPANLRNWNGLSIDQDLIEEGTVLAVSQSAANRQKNIPSSELVQIDQLNTINKETVNTQNTNNAQNTNKNRSDNNYYDNSNTTNYNTTKSNVDNNRSFQGATMTYRVVKGDNLYAIARKFGMTERELRELNIEKISAGSEVVREGDILIVNNVGGVSSNTNISNNSSNNSNSNNNNNNNNPTRNNNPVNNNSNAATNTNVSNKNTATNSNSNSNTNINNRITVTNLNNKNTTAAADNNKTTRKEKAKKAKEQEVYHTVTTGDNLYRISKKYQTTVDNIISLNGGRMNPDLLSLGQRIRVK